jgi:uncharacterized membrane protein YbhN (UPF0104 family)
VVVAALGGRLTLLRSTLINLAGIFVRNVTPTTGLGGDASRIALLRAEGVGLTQATASFVYVRAAELPAMVVVVVLALPAFGAILLRFARGITAGAGAIVIAGGVLWVCRHRLRAHVSAMTARIAQVRIGRGALMTAIVYATAAQGETILRQMVVAAAFGLPLTIGQSATVTALSIAGGLVPTVGSLGAIDGSLIAGLMLCGATAETAVAITLVERAISYGLSTALGAGALAMLGGRAILRVVDGRNRHAATAG